MRIDKWLWAARFYKTRALASEAIKGGRVHVHGVTIKPAREVQVGDRVEIRRGEVRVTVVVRGLAERRGPASQAARLYDETDESRAARERLAAERRLVAPQSDPSGARPTKRDRRRFEQTRGRG